MQEIITAMAPYITTGAIKGVLALVALIGITVGIIRKKPGGTVVLLLALAGWLLLGMLGKRQVTPLQIALFGGIAVFTVLLWWFRWPGTVNACLLLLAAAAEGTLYIISLVRAMWMLGTLYGNLEAVYGILCGLVFVWGAVYSVRLAFRPRRVKECEAMAATVPVSPLPTDVTLEEILPEPVEAHTITVVPAESSSVLPKTLLQTGVGADILRAKRQLDDGEISVEEFRKRKAVLMGQEV